MQTHRCGEAVCFFSCLKYEHEGAPILSEHFALVKFAFVSILISASIKIMFFFLFCKLMVLVSHSQSQSSSIRQSEPDKFAPQKSHCKIARDKFGLKNQKITFENTVAWRFSIAKPSISGHIRHEYTVFAS
jgi:hypothetical protein